MKLTLRRSGKYMTTIRIPYHVGKEMAIYALAAYRDAELFDEDDVTASRTLVERAIRNCLRDRGEAAELACREMVDDLDRGHELIKWATVEVERLFPEWRT